MRIWLLDILACPICKHYPLDLRILNWETDQKDFSKVGSAFTNRQLSVLEDSCILTLPNGKKEKCVKMDEGDQLQIEDEFSREKKPLAEYLRIVNEKVASAQSIDDATASPATKVLEQVKAKVTDTVGKTAKQFGAASTKVSLDELKKVFQGILPDIHLLNWYFFLTEVEEALITCKKCQRWYPVIETIPHLLPDDLRNADEDVAFLTRWSARIPEKVLNEGKPFNLKTEKSEKIEKRKVKAR
ncbi:MAG: Trm112 family protein [Promethearchaeati archaeon SRVP18_Atabeyarchaeia-1]